MEVKKYFISLGLALVLTIAMLASAEFFVPKIFRWEKIEEDNSVPEEVETEPSPEELDYRKAVEVYNEGKYSEAIIMFEALGNYKESENYYSYCQSAIEAEKEFQRKTQEYNNALALIDSKKYNEALVILRELGNFEESARKILEIQNILETEAADYANVGNYEKACEVLTTLGYTAQNNTLYQMYAYANEGNFSDAVLCGLSVVVFPDGTEIIPNNCFKDAAHSNNLKKVVLPPSVKTIGDFAFYGCARLTEINLPEGLISIGESAFDGCMGLKEIHFPTGLILIGKSAFASSGVSEIAFPSTLQTIGDDAFAGCDFITSIALPNSLSSMGKSAFSGCSGLLSVNIGTGLDTISENAFSYCERLVSVTISEGVKTIDPYAFRGCEMLTSVSLPVSLEKIEDNAFYQCKMLAEITIPINVNKIGRNVFAGCAALKKIYFDTTEGWTDGFRSLNVLDAGTNASKLVSSINTIWSRKNA